MEVKELREHLIDLVGSNVQQLIQRIKADRDDCSYAVVQVRRNMKNWQIGMKLYLKQTHKPTRYHVWRQSMRDCLLGDQEAPEVLHPSTCAVKAVAKTFRFQDELGHRKANQNKVINIKSPSASIQKVSRDMRGAPEEPPPSALG